MSIEATIKYRVPMLVEVEASCNAFGRRFVAIERVTPQYLEDDNLKAALENRVRQTLEQKVREFEMGIEAYERYKKELDQ